MKNLYKYISVAALAFAATGCADLDTQYYGYYVTSDQKADAVTANPELAQAAVSAVFSQFGSLFGQYTSNHYDFGYPSLMIGLDSKTADFHSKYSGYNWYVDWEGYLSPNQNGEPTGMTWLETYKQIKTANDLIANLDPESEDPTIQFYLGQGLAVRAFDYWVLAQLYQFNYAAVDPATAKTVPLITVENTEEASANGCARATVQETYDMILDDITNAISLIAKSELTPERVSDNKPKRMVSLAVAYGLRARIYLTMHKYAEAASDAQDAIDAFAGSPYSISDVSVPGFTSSEDNAWMWAIAVASTDRPVTTGICNWPSMMGSFNYGYCTVGAWRWISSKLYETIPSTDVRKGWWLDENCKSAHLSAAQQEYIDGYVGSGTGSLTDTGSDIMPYTQVKYGLFGGTMGEYCEAYDVPMMRIEEMYLILAEAQGMSVSVSVGAKTLSDFVSAYRDPSYKYTATDAAAFQEEVVRQRRIELWGEGLAYFDVMRLNQGIDRVGTRAADQMNYQIASGDPCLIFCIPQDELTANKLISAADNNPAGSRPTPVIQ